MQRPFQIAGIVRLIGINKDQVERRNVTKIFERAQRRAFNQFNAIVQPREVNILTRNVGMTRVGLQRDQLSGGRARAIQIEL